LRGGLNVYTSDKVRRARSDVTEQNYFNEKRDPIAHVFFRPAGRTEKILRDYFADVTNPPDAELFEQAREKRRKAQTRKKPPVSAKKGAAKTGIVGQLPA
jgi:hypothetical protein